MTYQRELHSTSVAIARGAAALGCEASPRAGGRSIAPSAVAQRSDARRDLREARAVDRERFEPDRSRLVAVTAG